MGKKVEIGNNQCYTKQKGCYEIEYNPICSECALSAYIINERIRLGVPITNIMLQCLLYYIKGFCIASENPCIAFAEDILATSRGPIIMSIYKKFMRFMSKAIDKKQIMDADLSSHILIITNDVLSCTLNLSQRDLVMKTKHEAPWLLTPDFYPISNELLIAEFEFQNIEKCFRGVCDGYSRIIR